MYLQIHGLPPAVREQDVWDFFYRSHLAQGVHQIKIIREDAFIVFSDENCAQSAYILDGMSFRGKPARISRISQGKWEQVTGERFMESNRTDFHSGEYRKEECYIDTSSAPHHYGVDTQRKASGQEWDRHGHCIRRDSGYGQERRSSGQERHSSGQVVADRDESFQRFMDVYRDFKWKTRRAMSMGDHCMEDLSQADNDYREEIRVGSKMVNVNTGDGDFRFEHMPEKGGFAECNRNRKGDNSVSLGNTSYRAIAMSLCSVDRDMKTNLKDRDLRCDKMLEESSLDDCKRDMPRDSNTSLGDIDYRETEMGLDDIGRGVNASHLDKDLRYDDMLGENYFDKCDLNYRTEECDATDNGRNITMAMKVGLGDTDLRSQADSEEHISVLLGDRDFRLEDESEETTRSGKRSSSIEGPRNHSERRDGRQMSQVRGIDDDYSGAMDGVKQKKQRKSSDENRDTFSELGYVVLYNVRNSVTAGDVREFFSGYTISDEGIIMKNSGNSFTVYVQFDSVEDAVRAEHLGSGIIHGQQIKIDRISRRQFSYQSYVSTTDSPKSQVPCVTSHNVPEGGSNQIEKEDTASLQGHGRSLTQTVSIPDIVFTKKYPYTSVFSPYVDNKEQCYLGLWNLPSSITACGVWAWYGGGAGRTLGVVLGRVPESQFSGDKMTMAFVVFRNPRDRGQAMSTFKFCTAYTAAEVHHFLVTLDHPCEIVISTKFRTDRLFTPDERSHIYLATHNKQTENCFPETEQTFEPLDPKNPPSHLIPWIEDRAFLLVGKVSKTATACEIWSVSNGDKDGSDGAMVIHYQRNWQSIAFVAFQSMSFARCAEARYAASQVHCSLDSAFRHLVPEDKVFISTNSGEDRLLNTAEVDLLMNISINIIGSIMQQRIDIHTKILDRQAEDTVTASHSQAIPSLLASAQPDSNMTEGPTIQDKTGSCGSPATLQKDSTDSTSSVSTARTLPVEKRSDSQLTWPLQQQQLTVLEPRQMKEQNSQQEHSGMSHTVSNPCVAPSKNNLACIPVTKPSASVPLKGERCSIPSEVSFWKSADPILNRKRKKNIERKKAMINIEPSAELRRAMLEGIEAPSPIQQKEIKTFKKIKLNLKR